MSVSPGRPATGSGRNRADRANSGGAAGSGDGPLQLGDEVGEIVEATVEALLGLGHQDHPGVVDGPAVELDGVEADAVPIGDGAPDHRILIAYAGVSRNLTGTPFNERVEECRSAARRVAELAGKRGVARLGDLEEGVLAAHVKDLPAAERGRARHFLSERRRVRAGVEAWRAGDLVGFGALMNESCRSSVENYETGSRELILLQQILLETPGVLGARFSGAGFGGCSVALVAAEAAEEVRARVEQAFVQARPELAGAARAFLVESEDGARIV